MRNIADKHLSIKIVISGEKVEIFKYQKPIRIPERETDFIIDVGSQKILDEIPLDLPEDERQKRADNLFRARRNVRQIIWSNITAHTKFLTLTYAKTVLDKKQVEHDLQIFFTAMKRQGFKLRYCYVLENQKERGAKEGNEGCLHVHLVIFNDEFIPFDVINKCWKHGSTDIKILDGLRYKGNNERVRDAGAYICKYITDENLHEFCTKTFRCSIGLKRPQVYSIYAYGGYDDRGRPNFVIKEDDEDVYLDFLKCFNPTWENTGVIDYKFDDVRIINEVYYTQGTLKEGFTK